MFKEIDRKTYSAKPFWAWNGKLEKEELLRQTQIMQQMGFGGYFMHSRTGLQTEYLGQEWFNLINACADSAQQNNMEAWLYDEDRWPSGSAGGIATAEKKYRMQYIRMNITMKDSFEWNDDIISAFAANVTGLTYTNCIQITEHTDLRAIDTTHILYFTQEYMIPTPTYNGGAYLNTLSREATEHYLESTHCKYKAACGERLGTSIQGIFTDEPHRGALMCGFSVPNHDAQNLCPYTDDLFSEFEKAFGYDLRSKLPELFLQPDGKPYAQVKWQYTELLTRLFLERFAKPYHSWCKENNLLVTGHVLHEDAPSCQVATNGSVMRYYEHMDYPGIDVLCENNNAYCIAKQLTSAARQLGKKWLLSELDGCTGWQMTFQNYKAIGDWQAIMGINLRCPHLSWYTMEGEAKRDYPASILHQSAWHKVYGLLEDYYARIGQITTNSKRLCHTAVIMPVESIWAGIHAGWAKDMSAIDENIQKIDNDFKSTYDTLLSAHVDFDYADEEMLSRLYRIENGKLWIGQADYDRVIVSGMTTIRSSTLSALKKFHEAGGEIIFAGEPPILVDALENSEAKTFAQNCMQIQIAQLNQLKDNTQISSPEILLQTYRDDEHTYYFLLNKNRTETVKDVCIDFGKNVSLQEWTPADGEKRLIQSQKNQLNISFAPGQMRLIVDGAADIDIQDAPVYSTTETDEPSDKFELTLDEPNVLVLDYAAWQIDDGQLYEPEEVLLIDRHLREKYGLEPRGGEMYQPWFTAKQEKEIKCGVTLYYSFETSETLSCPIYLMYEEPQNFRVTINGIPLSSVPEDGLFIDKCFTRVNISDYLTDGVNTITLQTQFSSESNIEAIYLLGDFGVYMPDKTLTAPQKDFQFASLTKQGLPFYGGRINYTLHFNKRPAQDEIAILHLKGLENNACYEVNGRPIGFEPYECDVTDSLRENGSCDVGVYLTRRNMFGPLHGVPKYLDAVGPAHFLGGESKDYVLYDAGLTEKPWIEFKKICGDNENV